MRQAVSARRARARKLACQPCAPRPSNNKEKTKGALTALGAIAIKVLFFNLFINNQHNGKQTKEKAAESIRNQVEKNKVKQ